MASPSRIKKYFTEVVQETKKVSWPTRQETLVYTVVVVIISILTAFFLGGLDYLFTFLLKKFILKI
ncbi:preprotein translocase subunit SecE [Patescibacteria group bacterium]|jgi:preprotein translocase subunit SecE|nr:preprotein translocase subunit SecE [Patescibacteria group bacterium]